MKIYKNTKTNAIIFFRFLLNYILSFILKKALLKNAFLYIFGDKNYIYDFFNKPLLKKHLKNFKIIQPKLNYFLSHLNGI